MEQKRTRIIKRPNRHTGDIVIGNIDDNVGRDRVGIDSIDMMIFDDKEEDTLLPWKEKSKREQELV